MGDDYKNLKINIKILLVENYFIFNKTNNEILIKVIDPDDNTKFIYEEVTYIKYDMSEYVLNKKYFFTTNYYYYYPDRALETKDFIINFNNPNILYLFVEDLNDLTNKNLYVFFITYNLPFKMLGAINVDLAVSVIFNLNVKTITVTIPNYSLISNVKNYTLENQNTLNILGNILSFEPKFIIQDSGNVLKFYNLYKLNTPFDLNKILKIYFYDTSYSYIQNIPYNRQRKFTTDSVTILIQIYYESTQLYQYLTNLNFDVINFDDIYNLVLFFNNTVNINYNKLVLRVFSYDYITYFVTTIQTDYSGCEQITLDKANLYSILIENNSNIPSLTILNLNLEVYNLNIDLIRFREMIFFEVKNIDVVSNFLKSGNIEAAILIGYLYNFKMKDYNLINLRFNDLQLENNQFLKVNAVNFQDIYKPNYVINFNNIQLNAILLNIEILYLNESNKTRRYNIYGMLINNNNTWDFYTKKVILTPENKYNLIKDFVIISTNYTQINIYAYNNIDDLNKNIKTTTLANTTMFNPFYKFNLMVFNKSTARLGFVLDDNDFLKFSLTLTIEYKFLIFKVNKAIQDTILNFKNDKYIFKIFRINGINSNPDPDTNLYSLLFANIIDVNYFMNYIEFGITDPPQKIKSYFNIQKSLFFKKDSYGFYNITTTPSQSDIFFSINNVNLEENNTFLINIIEIML